MGFLIIPTLLLILTPTPGARARALEDFSRFSKVMNQEIAIVDVNGTVREGVVAAAGPDTVTLKTGSQMQSFAKGEIAHAERLKDGRIDGAIKGALIGFVVAVLSGQGLESADEVPSFVTKTVASFSALGYLVDAGNPNRQRLYRAPAASPSPALSAKLSFRF